VTEPFDIDPDDPSPIFPAATVVPLRNGPEGLETLMLRRNSKLAFAGGAWVWPGGRIDPGDYRPDAPDDLEGAARRAAAREASEEADLLIDPDQLVWFAHWTPPAAAPKRFATYFFVVAAPSGGDSVVTVDMGEIHEHRWIRPADALRLRNAGDIDLTPPTWITLEQLSGFTSVDEVISALEGSEPEYFATRFAFVEGTIVAMYDGDAGYEAEDPSLPGARHRLTMAESGWRYDRHA
jgi:8-oxo-dGTP pyrophosphatase MutT (NUDIX family)